MFADPSYFYREIPRPAHPRHPLCLQSHQPICQRPRASMNVNLLLTVYIRSNCHAFSPLWHKRNIAARREHKRHESGSWTFQPFDLGALPVCQLDAPERCDMADRPIAAHIKVKSGYQRRVSVMGRKFVHLRASL